LETIKQILIAIAENAGTCPNNLEELKAATLNETEGTLTGCDCDICKNKGYIAVVKDGNIVLRDCDCMPRRRSLLRIERSGLKSTLHECTFETFQTLEKWQEEAKAKAMKYVTYHDGKWFLASGSVGGGKTHLCTAICGQFLEQGYEVRYMLWRDEIVKLKASVVDMGEYERLITPLKTVKVLYIDDFFKTERGVKPTTADINLAFEILNARYVDRKLLTIISTERTPEELLDIDEAVGSRIYERSRGYCVRIAGGNWRLR